jgi:multiple antibiotic resistance protein
LLVWTSFLLAFSALLPLINPLGTSLVFLGLVGEAPPEVYRSLARRIAINNIIFLAIIELLGSTILNFFGISLPIVQLSGGIVISAIGWSVLNQKDAAANTNSPADHLAETPEMRRRYLEQRVFYPFTFPITSGPGTLVTMLTLSAHIATPDWTQKVLGHVGIFLAVLVLSAGVYFCYAYAPKITKVIPASTAHGIQRVIAFILLCIGVQIAWNGLSVLLASIKHV